MKLHESQYEITWKGINLNERTISSLQVSAHGYLWFCKPKKNIDKLERIPNKSVPHNFDLSNIVQMSIGEFKRQL